MNPVHGRRQSGPLSHGVDSHRGEAYNEAGISDPLLVRPDRKVNMDAPLPTSLPPSVWLTRCIRQIRLVEPELNEKEAADVAQHLFSFERTVAMPPEKAVEFVVSELAGPSPRFERRSVARRSIEIQR